MARQMSKSYSCCSDVPCSLELFFSFLFNLLICLPNTMLLYKRLCIVKNTKTLILVERDGKKVNVESSIATGQAGDKMRKGARWALRSHFFLRDSCSHVNRLLPQGSSHLGLLNLISQKMTEVEIC